jgi:hypothetical protein
MASVKKVAALAAAGVIALLVAAGVSAAPPGLGAAVFSVYSAITGIFLGLVCIVGECVRGPVDRAVDITSPARFAEVFGGRDFGSGGPIIGKLWQAMLGKPFGALKIVRAAAAAAVQASTSFNGGLTASSGTILLDTKANHGNADTITIDDKINPAITFELDKLGDGVVVGNIAVDISTDTTAAQVAARLKTAIDAKIAAGLLALTSSINTATITLTATNLGTAYNLGLSKVSSSGLAVTPTAGTDEVKIKIKASSVGAWGNNVYADIDPASDGVAAHYNVIVDYLGEKLTFKNIDTSAANVDNSLAVLGDDDGNWIAIEKIANGRPFNSARAALGATVAGSDGSIADTDFTATGRALDVAGAVKGVGSTFVAERMSATLKGKLLTLASAASDRIYLMCSDAGNTSDTTVKTEAGTTYKSNRVAYAHNWPYYTDPENSTAIQCMPTSTLASILSQTDVQINPGDEDAKAYTSGIVRLTKESYNREDFAAFKAAGVIVLDKDDGFGFVSGVLTDGSEIADRREVDFLQLSIAGALKHYVKKPNTESRRVSMHAVIHDFLDGLQQQERVVEGFEILTGSVAGNTATSRGQNIEKFKIRVRLIGHMNYLVLDTEIGTTVQITARAA